MVLKFQQINNLKQGYVKYVDANMHTTDRP